MSRSSTTQLPPVRRTKRRDWGRIVARILCVLFALCGLVPVGVGLLVRTSWARGIATVETRKALEDIGVDAKYDLELKLWPLSVGTRNVEVASTDGHGPFLTARRVTAKPKIFGLLAGKLVIDEIEIEKPQARVVIREGKLANLALNLPPSTDKPDKPGPTKAPFSVVSASEADVDIDSDGTQLALREIDADVTVDDDGAGGSAFEIALRASSGSVKTITEPGEWTQAISEDVFCRVDGRARIESKRLLVRRLSVYGALDLDPSEGTAGNCQIAKDDKRYTELEMGHLQVDFPNGLFNVSQGIPNVDGHIKARAPLGVINRFPHTPEVDGWVAIDVELRYTTQTMIPDMAGKVDAGGLRVSHFQFARTMHSDFLVRRSIITATTLTVEIADGVAEFKDIEVRPFEKDVPVKVPKLDIKDVSFSSLMKDLGVAKHPHVTWDIKEVHFQKGIGTLHPLHIDGDLVAHTQNFAVYDAFVDLPVKHRATGISRGDIQGKLAVRQGGVEFRDITINTPRGHLGPGVLVGLQFHEVLHIEVPQGKLELDNLSPLGDVGISGVADIKATANGPFTNPHIEGDISVDKFALGDPKSLLQFGNMKEGHVTLDHRIVTVRDIHMAKGKSTFEMPTGRLDFNSDARLKMDGSITTKNLDVRDFLNVFKMDDDPRLAEINATLEANARMHLSLGGAEDVCKGGYLDVQATTTAHDINLLGEKFDEAQADLEYRWIDRQAGIEGAEIDVRSLSLTKVKKAGRAAIGSILGSVAIHRGGDLRGSLVLQGFPLQRTDILGSAAQSIEGSMSGIARLGGTISAFEVDADLDVGPTRILGAPFGSSNLHVGMVQTAQPMKVVGRSPCGAPIQALFDKEAYVRDIDRVNQGKYTVDGKLFGGQVKLDNVVVTRQKAPVITGKVGLEHFDLAPIGRLIVKQEEPDPNTALGGAITGDIDLEVATSDLAHAKVQFVPHEMRFSRGGQKLALRVAPSKDQEIVVKLADDEVTFPAVTFDLQAPNGFKGAFGVKGSVKRVTRGGELGLEAELSPIDLGILVGIVPRMTRANGTLTGSLKVSGRATQPALAGQLKIRKGEFAVKGLPGNLTDVEMDVVADENEARITSGSGHFLGGDIGVTGRMPLTNGQLGALEANLTGRQLSITPIEGVKSTVDADLKVTLNPTATASQLPSIGGEVTITSFEYTKPFNLVSVSGITGGAKRTEVDSYDPSLDSVMLNFDVRSRVPLRFRNNLVDASLGIDSRGIHVSGTNQRVGLRGELAGLPGGHFRLFANDFELQKATIRFDDPTRIVPHVDITAVTEYRRYTNTLAAGTSSANTTGSAAVTTGSVSSGGASGALWRITLHAYGTGTDDLQVDMTSDPPLSREDIVLLLTIGLTRAEVDQVQAGSASAGLAFEAIGTASGVDRAVKQAIPVIDDFRPGTAYSPRTGRVEPNITVGRRLTENVRARLTSGLAEDPQLRSSIEWRLNRSFTVEPSYDRISTVSSSNIGNFGVDLRWRLEFE